MEVHWRHQGTDEVAFYCRLLFVSEPITKS